MSAKYDTIYHFVPLSDVFIKKNSMPVTWFIPLNDTHLETLKKRQNGHYATEALPWCNDRYPIE